MKSLETIKRINHVACQRAFGEVSFALYMILCHVVLKRDID